MALQHIRSSTLDKRPQPASLSDGQLAINTNVNAPGVFFKDSNGTLVKVGPTFVGTTAPNSTPASGGASGNTLGEQWLDTSGTNPVLKIWDGSAWQSEAGEFVNVSGDTMTGALVMDNQQQIRFRETTANGTNYIALQAPASVAFDKTITLPDVTGTVVTTGDTGSVTSTMIADGTIVNGDVNASAAIAGTKIDPDFGSQTIETTGVFSAAGGAAATPSITFTGDLNTGIYSPGADQLAISTNGTGRLFIDSSGRLGVGTASPGSFDSSANVLVVGSGSGDQGVTLYAGSASSSAINFADGTAGSAPYTGRILYQHASDAMTFHTSGGTERARIDSSGRLGLGTSSPGSKLTVDNGGRADPSATGATTQTNAALQIAATSETNTKFFAGIATSSRGWLQVQNSSDGGTNDILLNPIGGRVGIGTATPAVALDVYGAVNLRSQYNLTWGGVYGAGIPTIVGDSSASYLAIYPAGSTSGEKLRVDSSGRLLVGTPSTSASCSAILQGRSGSATGESILKLACGTNAPSSGSPLGGIEFTDSGHSFSAQIAAERDGGTWTSGSSQPSRLKFSTTADGASSPTERARITNLGAFKATTTGNYSLASNSVHELRSNQNNRTVWVSNTNAGPYGIYVKYEGYDPNGTDNEFLVCDGNGTIRASIRSNGGLANYSANNVNLSDRNVKKDIAPAAGTWDCLKEWEIVNFRYKDQLDDADLNMGVIAQQVAESCPEVITVFQEETEDQPEKLGVKDQQMMWMAIKALQEAQLRIETLEAEVAALKGA
jgi:hypothetical protein